MRLPASALGAKVDALSACMAQAQEIGLDLVAHLVAQDAEDGLLETHPSVFAGHLRRVYVVEADRWTGYHGRAAHLVAAGVSRESSVRVHEQVRRGSLRDRRSGVAIDDAFDDPACGYQWSIGIGDRSVQEAYLGRVTREQE